MYVEVIPVYSKNYTKLIGYLYRVAKLKQRGAYSNHCTLEG